MTVVLRVHPAPVLVPAGTDSPGSRLAGSRGGSVGRLLASHVRSGRQPGGCSVRT